MYGSLSLLLLCALGARAAVTCSPAALGAGNLTITRSDDKQNPTLLGLDPVRNATGAPFLQRQNGLLPTFTFQECSSDFMGYPTHKVHKNKERFFGHVTATFNGTDGCLNRDADQALVTFGPCSFSDDASQIAQFWVVARNVTDPVRPAPLHFLGAPKGQRNGTHFSPGFGFLGGNEVVSEVANLTQNPSFALHFVPSN